MSMYRYLRDPIHCLAPLVRQYGDPFTFPGKTPLVCTGDPAGIRAIYTAEADTLAPLNEDFAVFLGKNQLLLQSGAEHRRARKAMMPPFHGARMRAYGEAMCRITEEAIDQWQRDQVVSVHEVVQRISLDVILQAIFGVRDRARMGELAKLLLDIVDGLSPLIAMFPALRREFGGIGPFARFRRRQERLHAELDALAREARVQGPREDILSLLLQVRYDDGEPMSDDELREQLLVLVFAGHETTAIAIAWACYALHRPENAAALERLREELAALGPDPEVEELAKQPYLDAVCQETLRRFPLAPAPAPRKLLRPLELLGHELPEGAAVAAAISVAHFREDTYPDPMQFRPERFLERKFTPFEFLPFGGGARRCLGAAMANYELRLVLATLLKRYRLRLESLRPDAGKVRAANVGPAHGVRMVVEERLA